MANISLFRPRPRRRKAGWRKQACSRLDADPGGCARTGRAGAWV